MNRPGKVLLLTVGTGTANDLEATVLQPFAKSLKKGEWASIVLFPSRSTDVNARLLQQAHSSLPIEIRSLRKEGQEENVDQCFAHFDSEIARLIDAGFEASSMVADFTRGTKAMSAGLALASVAHGIGSLRYIGAKKRDARGMAIPGAEVPSETSPESVLQRQAILRGISHLRAGNFKAAASLFPGWPTFQYPGPRSKEIRWLGWAAAFWGAWDTFDYKVASQLAALDGLPTEWPAWVREFLPSDEQKKVLKVLCGPEPPKNKDNLRWCRHLAADLLANAGRRISEGQAEEALVRLYRVFELMGQLRLFGHDLDTARLSASDPRVSKWLQDKAIRLTPNHDGSYQIGREMTASLLSSLGDPLAAKLENLDWLGEFQPRLRNTSILIHGFKARTRQRVKEVLRLHANVQAFLEEENDGNSALIQASRFTFLG